MIPAQHPDLDSLSGELAPRRDDRGAVSERPDLTVGIDHEPVGDEPDHVTRATFAVDESRRKRISGQLQLEPRQDGMETVERDPLVTEQTLEPLILRCCLEIGKVEALRQVDDPCVDDTRRHVSEASSAFGPARCQRTEARRPRGVYRVDEVRRTRCGIDAHGVRARPCGAFPDERHALERSGLRVR